MIIHTNWGKELARERGRKNENIEATFNPCVSQMTRRIGREKAIPSQMYLH